VADAIADIDAPATVELVELLKGIAHTRSAIADDIQLEMNGRRSRLLMRGMLRDAGNTSMIVVVSCREGCR
jgi:hypothetical protein